MPETNPPARQGFAAGATDRMPLPADSAMSEAQRAAARALTEGPRKGVYGPFLPLLRSPVLLERMAKVGEYLRFESVLDGRLRELVTCAAARHVGNQYEWVMHAPLARAAGVAESTLAALRAGARPLGLPADEETALDFTTELLHTNGTSDTTYERAIGVFGEQGVVELTTLIGYFVAVSWLMNVARTPAQRAGDGLDAFPQ